MLRIANSDMERLDGASAPFRNEIANLPLGRLLFAQVKGSPVRMFREQRHVSDGNADFTLIVSRTGGMSATSGDAAADFVSVGAALVTYWRPASVSFAPRAAGGYEVFRYQVPRELMETVVDNPDALCFRPAAVNAPALNYLVQYSEGLLLKQDFADPALADRTATHLLDLIATILGPSREAGEIAQRRGVRAGRLQSILSYIDANYCNVKLDVEAVAARHGVSVRYVQRLMETQGETFSNYVLRLRLERVACLLRERNQPMRIGDIAIACGFNDLSYFNRSFKRRFGENPRKYRRG